MAPTDAAVAGAGAPRAEGAGADATWRGPTVLDAGNGGAGDDPPKASAVFPPLSGIDSGRDAGAWLTTGVGDPSTPCPGGSPAEAPTPSDALHRPARRPAEFASPAESPFTLSGLDAGPGSSVAPSAAESSGRAPPRAMAAMENAPAAANASLRPRRAADEGIVTGDGDSGDVDRDGADDEGGDVDEDGEDRPGGAI